MSTSLLRYAAPALPALVSWYATPSPPLSKFSACTMPGSDAGVPPKGVPPYDGGGGGGGRGALPADQYHVSLTKAPPVPSLSPTQRHTPLSAGSVNPAGET